MTHVSVMVPVYNRESLIRYTLESALCQTHQDFDLTIVDDASTDATVSIVQEYCEDPRVLLIRNHENLGLTRNWNRCLELARGPLVQILQSDDLVDADYLERVNRIFDIQPNVGFVSANCRYIDRDGKPMGLSEDKPDGLFRAGDEAVRDILLRGFPHVSSIVMRRSTIELVGMCNEAIWHGPDVEFDARMASRVDHYRIGKASTSFRRHGTNRGYQGYLRKDYLPIHILKMKLAWGYLSECRRREIGVRNLSTYINSDAAQIAVGGAIMMVAYGRFELGKYYLWKSIELNPAIVFALRFWRALGVNLIPRLGQKMVVRRVKITEQEQTLINNSELR